MFSRSEFCLHLGLNPNDEDVRASSQRLFARVPWHPRHACVPYFVCERGSYVHSPVSGAVPTHAMGIREMTLFIEDGLSVLLRLSIRLPTRRSSCLFIVRRSVPHRR